MVPFKNQLNVRRVSLMLCALMVGMLIGVEPIAAQSSSSIRQANANRVRLKTTLTDDMVQKFLAGQTIIVRVPSGTTAIGSLIVKRSESFKDEAAAVKPRISVQDSVAVIEVSRSLFQRLDYQPLRIRIFESDITRIELRPAIEDGPDSPRLEPNPVSAAPEFYVRLKPAKGVPIVIKDGDGFRLTNDVFDHVIPYDVIGGIYFDRKNRRQVTVVLDNGDNLTGVHHWPVIVELDTKWGVEEVSLDEILSVTRSSATEVIESGSKSPKLIVEEKK